MEFPNQCTFLRVFNTYFVLSTMHGFVICIHKYCHISLQNQCTDLNFQQWVKQAYPTALYSE